MIPPGAIGALSAAAVGSVQIAQTGTSSENLFVQMGGVGLALGVGMYFIRRSDRRDDVREAQHHTELELERAAHEETRKLLIEAIREMRDHKDTHE